jgi:hypothetical protein
MAYCEVRRSKRQDRQDEPSFIEIDIDDMHVRPATAAYPEPSPSSGTASTGDVAFPDEPEESETIPDAAMSATKAAWHRAAAQVFKAGTHGPVEFPLRPDVSELPRAAPGHVLVASNFRSTSSLPIAHQAFLAQKIAKEVMVGSVRPVRSWREVAAIMPTFVAENPTTGKLRVIFDARALNALLRDPRGVVRYDDVRLALQQAICCTKLDIEGAYRHVRVKDEQQRYLCFEIAGILYQYTCLPFGVSWAPALFLDAVRPIVAAARREGIRLVWYMDDFLIVADDVDTLDRHTARLIHLLIDGGWQPAVDKTFPYAFRTIPFLGLLIEYADDGTAQLRVPVSKCTRIAEEAQALIDKGIAHVSSLQKICGRLNFARIVAPQLGFMRRGLDAATADGLRAFHGVVPVQGRLAADLIAVAHAARTSLATITLSANDDVRRPQLGRVYSDASAVGWGALHLHPEAPVVHIPPDLVLDGMTDRAPRGWTVGGRFSDADQALSSGAREVRAVALGVAALNLRDGHVGWHCDATVAVHSITAWSSRADHVAQGLTDLWDSLQARNLSITVSHVFRHAQFMPVADWLSRMGWRDAQAEWAVEHADVARIAGALSERCDADMFASSRNARFPAFCSRWLERGAMGDAFHLPWEGRRWWAFPPTSQLDRFVTRWLAYQRLGIARASAATVADAAAAARIAAGPRHSSSSSSSAPISRVGRVSSSSFTVVLLFPDVPSAPFADRILELRKHAVRDLCVFRPTPGRQLCPGFRLIDGDGVPAPRPPPWPLRAISLHVRL